MRKSFMLGALLLVVGIAGMLFSFNGSPDKIFNYNLAAIDQSASFPAAGVAAIKADIGSSDIRLEKALGDEIEVRLEGKNAKRYAEKTKLLARTEGDTLVIETEHPDFQIGIITNELRLRIAVPEKAWDAIELTTGSGDMTIGNLRASRIALTTGSGSLKLSSIEGERLSVKTGSGEVGLSGYRGSEVDVSVLSGDVRLRDVEAEAAVETGSGDIEIETSTLTHNTSLRTGSGDVEIELDAAPESLAFDFYTTSGDTTIEFGGFMLEGGSGGKIGLPEGSAKGKFGDGQVQLHVRTGSGDIELSRR